jgi:hypothetical protein
MKKPTFLTFRKAVIAFSLAGISLSSNVQAHNPVEELIPYFFLYNLEFSPRDHHYNRSHLIKKDRNHHHKKHHSNHRSHKRSYSHDHYSHSKPRKLVKHSHSRKKHGDKRFSKKHQHH